jgi:hypothetical protein
MTPLYLFDGKLLLVGDALAASSGCCCGGFYCYKSTTEEPCICECAPGEIDTKIGYRYFAATNNTDIINHPDWGTLTRSGPDQFVGLGGEDPEFYDIYYQKITDPSYPNEPNCPQEYNPLSDEKPCDFIGEWKIEPWDLTCESPSGILYTETGVPGIGDCVIDFPTVSVVFENYPKPSWGSEFGYPRGWYEPSGGQASLNPILYVKTPKCPEWTPIINISETGNTCTGRFFIPMPDPAEILPPAGLLGSCGPEGNPGGVPEVTGVCCTYYVSEYNGCEIVGVTVNRPNNPPWACSGGGADKFVGTGDWYNLNNWVDTNGNPATSGPGSIINGGTLHSASGDEKVYLDEIINGTANYSVHCNSMTNSTVFSPGPCGAFTITADTFTYNNTNIEAPITADGGTFSNGSYLNGGLSLNGAGVVVFQDSFNSSSNLTAPTEMRGSSINYGTIINTCTFYDTSVNDGDVDGAVFEEDSENNGTVNGNAVFKGDSKNYGTVTGDADFQDNSCNSGTVNGTITGNPPACP